MGKFNGPSPKRHLAWSNDCGFVQELVARGGYLSMVERQALLTRLAKRGTKNGKATFQGVKKTMKKSQPLCCSACVYIYVSLA